MIYTVYFTGSIATIVFSFFSTVNFVKQNYPIALLDATAGIFTLLALVRIYLKKEIFISAVTGSIAMFIFLISFVTLNQNSSFGIIWTIFYPIFVITLLGRIYGLFFTLIYYAILFYMAFRGIDVWQNGMWDVTSFLRFSIASLVLSYVIYMNEYAMEKAQIELDRNMQEVAKNTKSLEILSITDSLTSFYNRRHFDEVFRETLKQVKREEDTLIFFIYDLDFFKRFNDTYGHKAGDNALIAISQKAKSFFKREGDMLFRIGGEEFAGIIKAEDTNFAIEHMHQFCKEIEALHIVHQKNDASSYLSISVGAVIINHKERLEPDYLYKKADDALYEAKSLGRNRVVFATPPL